MACTAWEKKNNYDNNMDRHFGKSYCHWLWLDIDPGVYKLWTLCRDDAAAACAREEAPLRLVSWLSFRLFKKCHEFIQTAMDGRPGVLTFSH